MKGIAITCLVTLLSATLSQAKVVVSEDFQKFTSGTDTSADMSAEVTDFNTLTQTEGWTGATVYQAGGSAYLAIGTGLLTSIKLGLCHCREMAYPEKRSHLTMQAPEQERHPASSPANLLSTIMRSLSRRGSRRTPSITSAINACLSSSRAVASLRPRVRI